MKMSKLVCIDGFSMSINKKQRGFLQFLIENGFFREVGEDTYVSLPKNRTASLSDSDIYVSPTAPSTKPHENIDSPSMLAASEFLISLLASRSALISFNDFALLVLSRYNFPLLAANPKICMATKGACDRSPSEAREGRGGLGGYCPPKERPQVTYVPCIEETTEGSEFGELDRNELLPVENPVKQKRNTPMIEAIKKLGLDEDLEKLAEEWREFAIEKKPWMKDRSSIASFYVGLMKVQNAIKLNNQNMNVSGLREIFMFIRNDNFWKDQALSPNQLLTPSRNGVRKVDNILLSINKKIRKTAPLQGVDFNTEEAPF